MRAGFFAPLPPARTGVADYAAVLLDALRRHGEVTVGAEDADIALYHLGNNHLHREIYSRAIRRPGVAMLHDAVLQHFFLGTLTEAQYLDEFVYSYGEWTRGTAQDLWKNRARSAADPRYFEYPMLKRVACASRAIIVHNPAAARMVLAHNPQARVVEIPHFFVPPALPEPVDTLRLRTDLGIGPRTLLAGVFGHLRESKRLTVILRAMDRVWHAGADLKLLVQGAFASSDLERSLGPRLASDPRIVRIGFLESAKFWQYAAATDVCLNLRYPTAGETSGIAISMMGIGKPVIFTAGEEIARLPENACLRIQRGPAEEETLADHLLWLAANREAAEAIGRHAAAHIREHHQLDRVAQQYWHALREAWANRA